MNVHSRQLVAFVAVVLVAVSVPIYVDARTEDASCAQRAETRLTQINASKNVIRSSYFLSRHAERAVVRRFWAREYNRRKALSRQPSLQPIHC